MLSQKFLNVVKTSRSKISLKPNFLSLSTSPGKQDEPKSTTSYNDLKLFKNRSLVSDDYVDKNNVRRPFFEADMDFFKIFHSDESYQPDGIMNYLKWKIIKRERKKQRPDYDKIKYLGSDLAAGYFVLLYDGKIKYKGHDWLNLEGYKKVPLPKMFDSNYIATGIDLSDVALHYEGLENFQNLPRVKEAIFARSLFFDDWFADKVAGLFLNLEYLDISECPKVTERALEAFYRLSNLKTLRITNYSKSASFELTCMMLEDVIPGLTIEILEPPQKEKKSGIKIIK